jgi:hypothetical protein
MFHLSRILPLAALGISAMAMADDPQLYRWTDAKGTVHYSDQPPSQSAPDLTTAAMPSFPAVDPVKLAQRQAALMAQVAALQQLTQAQLSQQAQAAALAQQQAELQAAQAQQAAQEQPAPAQPIYISSDFVPRVYRANLYVSRRFQHPHVPRPVQDRPPVSLVVKP